MLKTAYLVPTLFKLAEAPDQVSDLVGRVQQFAQNFQQTPDAQQAQTTGLAYGTGIGGLLGAGLGGLYGWWGNRGEQDKTRRRRRMLGSILAGAGVGGIGGGLYGRNLGLNDAWYSATGLRGVTPAQAGSDPKALTRSVNDAIQNNHDLDDLQSKLNGGVVGRAAHLITGT